ncbi:hypothetical protein Syun_005159 [Stephania yunnanensis]|uniref:Uncharacterized protein n=1 Tax=Stephania yunnanensis TaxID=152371 RepID=A0AAP0Q1G7_9MAGN
MAAEEGQVIGCHTVESWTEQLQKGNDSNGLALSRLDHFHFQRDLSMMSDLRYATTLVFEVVYEAFMDE